MGQMASSPTAEPTMIPGEIDDDTESTPDSDQTTYPLASSLNSSARDEIVKDFASYLLENQTMSSAPEMASQVAAYQEKLNLEVQRATPELGEKDTEFTPQVMSVVHELTQYDFTGYSSRWNIDIAQKDKDMLSKPEMISVMKYLHEVEGYDLGLDHFTSWDPDSENYIMHAPVVCSMAHYLRAIGWSFEVIPPGYDQHLRAGHTPPRRRQYPPFNTAYSRVRDIQPSQPGADVSQLQIDIDDAPEQLMQSPASTSTCQLQINIDAAYKRLLPSERRMHKVSRQLRMMTSQQSKSSVYDPIMVSLGPYHHGKEEFRQAEEFKHLCLDWCTNGSDELKGYLYDMVRSNINRIRGCYAQVSTVNKFDDDALAVMMLLDACFIINFMRIRISNETAKDTYNCLGVAAALPFAARDIMVLENQIPLFVLKMLISAMGSTEEIVLEEFLSGLMSMEQESARIPREAKDPPLHILEACRRMLVEDELSGDPEVTNTRPWIGTIQLLNTRLNKRSTHASKENTVYALKPKTCYHVTSPVSYLKAKGIRFLPSSSHSLKDIKFTSRALYGELQLPVCYVSTLTTVFISNMIAYEVSPDNVTVSPDLTVLSYTNFMKSLIQTPADVMELQRKGILRINRLGNQEEVVHLFKSIETLNLRDVSIYQDVMLRLGEHCNSKGKTWTADLIHSKLNSPWTIIALLSAVMLLVLTFLQTFYTIHPVN